MFMKKHFNSTTGCLVGRDLFLSLKKLQKTDTNLDIHCIKVGIPFGAQES